MLPAPTVANCDRYGAFGVGLSHDVAVKRFTKALKWKSKGIRIIYTSPALPPYNITASKKIDNKLFNNIQKAFTKLDVNNPKHKIVVKSLSNKYDGFIETMDADYDVVRSLIKPFSK